MRLLAIDDVARFAATRTALHAVAEHVLAAYRYRAERRIGLVVTADGFGTPTFGDEEAARITGDRLVIVHHGRDRAEPLTTLGAAAAACGIQPGAPDVYPPSTPLDPDAPLTIDATAAARVIDWLSFGWTVLEELARDEAASVTLWPEHFDVATDLGDEARAARGTFGASPGDDGHPTPYLYVTHWAPKADDTFWNDAAFGGASLDYEAILTSADPVGIARTFFEQGRAALARP